MEFKPLVQRLTGVILLNDKAELAFVECKLSKITLKDVSQLLGYSKVACPVHSFIISPKGMSNAVSYLLQTLRRYDILAYSENRKIRVGSWDESKGDIIRPMIPPF